MKRIIQGQIFYSQSYLTGKVNLSYRTVEKWIEGKIVEDHENWFCKENIPAQSLQKIEIYENSERLQYLADAYNEDFVPYLPKVVVAGVKPSKREAKAKEWAVLDRIAKLTDEENSDRVSIKQAFELYCALRLPKAIINYFSFSKKLANFRRNPEAAIVDAKTGKAGNNSKKTDRHNQILERLYSLPNKYKVPAIAEMANEIFRKEGLKELSYETVKKCLADESLRQRTFFSRYGNKAHTDKQKSFIKFEKSPSIGNRAEMDGVKLPFKVWDKEGKKLVRPWMFALIDTYSGKVTGWSLDYSETRWLVLQTFKKQAENGWFPSEIWTDNFSGKDTPEFLDVKAKIEARGTKFQYCRVGHSQGKPFIERFFGTFQDRFCREYGDWEGMAITSKNADNRPNPEAYKAYVEKHGRPTMENIRERIAYMLEKYHNTSFRGKHTPNQLFAACREAQTVLVAEPEIPYLFWHKTEAKVNRGKVTIEVKKQQYVYHLPEQYNGQTLVIRYEPEDLSEVYAFANDATEIPLAVLEQKFGTHREYIKENPNKADLTRKERKAEEAKAMAMIAPHLTPKEILSLAEDEAEEELMYAYQPTHRSPAATRPSLKVYQPIEEED